MPDFAAPPAANWNRFNFSWGHMSVQTTERYLGCTQRIACAVKDKIGIEPAPSTLPQDGLPTNQTERPPWP